VGDLHRLFTDGGARGNPGPAGIGVVLEDSSGEVVETVSRGLGWQTNNVAEYEALIEGLLLAKRRGVRRLKVVLDSLLVAEQMKGNYRVRNRGLKPLHEKASRIAGDFDEVEFESVGREDNAEADRLANEAMDRWIAENPDARPPDPPQRELF
jgi:ribonuclease HI